ncbi:hypothetical protein E1180_17320 [Roseibium denhamense]|uniref:DUF4760 domain-containing protein n=1 Tax=Roseibium denhamense TaxID=76305 RepID=A0ABY1P6A3_9HYPH|nr:hypothetical protein [Roseibium denhamense]MTI07267.1 hypothetical protein [Roseibium denhamense]SMP26198.1 hypothetical protein SAMN06265374_2683 [Roseibium denhamense]
MPSIGEWAAVAGAVATWVLALFGIWQLRAIRVQSRAAAEQTRLLAQQAIEQNRRDQKWKTLEACRLLDTDPILDQSTARIWDASANGTDYSNMKAHQRDIINLLNHLDAIAIGVQQGLYIEEIARDHLDAWFKKVCSEFLREDRADQIGITRSHFTHLIDLNNKWLKVETHYRDT